MEDHSPQAEEKTYEKFLDKCFNVSKKLVDEAGEIIAKSHDRHQDFEEKAFDIDLVTETDKQVEQHIIIGIKKEFPDHKFIGEEESAQSSPNLLTDDPTWIIDPVDGTMNFVHTFPHSCISVALVVKKQIEIGIICNPILGQQYIARRGRGAFFNTVQVFASKEKRLSHALICTEIGTSRDEEKYKIVMTNIQKIASMAHGIRMLGSAALNMCHVACGQADAYYEFGIHAWDVCAGALIVREAGGTVIDPSGLEFDLMSRRVLCAGSSELATDLSNNLKQYFPEPRDDGGAIPRPRATS